MGNTEPESWAKKRPGRDARRIKTRSLPDQQQKSHSDRVPSSPECDICAVKHDDKPCVYSPAHGKIGNGFFCFECYQSWEDYQLHLDGLTYCRSEQEISKQRPIKAI